MQFTRFSLYTSAPSAGTTFYTNLYCGVLGTTGARVTHRESSEMTPTLKKPRFPSFFYHRFRFSLHTCIHNEFMMTIKYRNYPVYGKSAMTANYSAQQKSNDFNLWKFKIGRPPWPQTSQFNTLQPTVEQNNSPVQHRFFYSSSHECVSTNTTAL